jgi:hypothetical protein
MPWNRIIVTRHPALVEVLREDFDIEGEAHEHATAELVRDRAVIGVLPLHLAALAFSVTAVDLDLPPELRGKELTVDEVRRHLKGLTPYKVQTLRGHFNTLNQSFARGWEEGMKREATEYEPH